MIRHILSILVCLAVTAGCLAQQYGDRDPYQSAGAAAERALDTFAKLVDERNYRQMGFQSPDEVERATLGRTLAERMVRLDRLREYAGGPVEELLTDTGRVKYLVEVNGEVRSSLTVGNRGDSWHAESFGGANYAELVAAAALRMDDSADLFELRVPALNVTFLATRRDGGLVLVPIVDDAGYGFTAGEPIPAEEALSALVEAAREHNGLPT